jgi:WD40-like Beta Propeller Repeat
VSKGLGFALLVVGALGLAGGYVGWKALDESGPAPAAPNAAANLAGGQRIVFQNVDRDAGYAQVASVAVSNPSQGRRLTGVVCERVHYSAGRGICLMPRNNVLGQAYDAFLLDAKLERRHRIALPGINSRARVSPDGRYAAATGFVSGDSYADQAFSTRTFILDLQRGRKVANLEDFAVFREGERIRSIDFNFWGVTFASNGRFYATLQTRGKTYLVRGNVSARRVEVLREGVECPSLSPDGTRIAFKKRVGEARWRLSVLDLRTLRDWPLSERNSVDDQAEWLSNDEVLYGRDAAVWSVRADGKGAPRLLIAEALSPAVPRA